ncbi:hypothetical protein BDN71DRAFT_1441235 [Pleurotus eryngii]|uniref:Uncharacterized protein n=1 Tax=Pleurotus eryngii TaxID=5323 RepID=A0A9P6DJ86_PLEER|nr:hypothetical protein BDN71DRAFT_1441235 [Pleurotus eryngii]
MKFSVIATSLFCAVLALAQTTGFTINTPTNPVQCQPLLISWVGGQGPFFLSVRNGDDPSGPAIADLGEQPAGATSFSWQRVNFQANTRLGFSLRDQTGATAQSAAVTVQAGPDNSCLNGGSSSSVSGSDSASGTTSTSAAAPGTTTTSAPAAPTTTAPGATSTTAAVTSGASTSASRTSSVTRSGTAAPAQTSNAASAQVAQIGAAGLVGAALAAILA